MSLARLRLTLPGWLVRVEKLSWAAFLISLPVTSFPYFPPAIGGEALVRPLALYPLAVLGVLVVLPRLLKGRLPYAMLGLGAFAVVAVASAAFSLPQDLAPALGVSSEARVARALITLFLGIAFYLAAALTPRSVQDLRDSLRYLYSGFGLALAWGTLQVPYVIHFNPEYYALIRALQRFISIRKPMENRVSGATYEPNWFAEQVTFLLLPWLMAAVISGRTVFPWRWRWLTVEVILLVWACVLLPLTYSRAGLLNLGLLVVMALLLFRSRLGGKRGLAATAGTRPAQRWWIWGLRRVGELVIVLGLLGGLFFVAGTRNAFFARIWGYWERPDATLDGYLEYIGFGARLIYAETAYYTYASAPWFGVGPGNYALLFEEMLPDRPLMDTPEVLRILTPEEGRDRLITAKNLYLRILAEMGLLGAVTFAAFLISLLGGVVYLLLSAQPEARTWGSAGLLGLGVFAASAISFDSFAVPNMWIVFGLVTAAVWVYSHPPETAAADLLVPVYRQEGLENLS